ncbi:MAG TPA: hypothetical protein VFT90_09910 [Chryseosolibacter sp.]|nr:hypothetical protein [Chryseosolibacter sp.]
MNTLTREHMNTRLHFRIHILAQASANRHQHTNTPTHQHLNTSTPQHLTT